MDVRTMSKVLLISVCRGKKGFLACNFFLLPYVFFSQLHYGSFQAHQDAAGVQEVMVEQL